MHSALSIPKVFSSIVDCLAEDTVQHPARFPAQDTDKAGRRALAVLARTCRAFSKPALDALWRRLHTLKPLLLCLPSKASYIHSLDGPLSPFNEEEWRIVLRYAPLVQEFTLENDYLSVKILQSLWFRTTLLLPNLRKLHWVHGDYTAVASIRMLLSPSLIDLHLWVKDDDHTSILAFLESYHILCPNLKSLSFSHPARVSQMITVISRAISRFPNLETLSCDDIDEEILIHVTQSRCLKELRCYLLRHEPDVLRRIACYGGPDHPPFENLRILKLHVNDLSSIIPYLKSQHQPLEEVTIDLHMVSISKVFYEFFSALSSATRRGTLQQIRLSTYCSIRSGISLQAVDFQILSPLVTLNLHKLEINIPNPISLNDDEFIRLVRAWPELTTFHLSQHSKWDRPPSIQLPTLRGLLLLLARCPKLQALGLCVDARNIPSLSEYESSIRNTTIEELWVANSPIQEPVTQVAHFLLDHLPSLETVSAYGTGTGDHRTWKRVDEEIKQILGRRRPERSDDEVNDMWQVGELYVE